MDVPHFLLEYEHLRSCWPYDEIDALVTEVLKDGVIDEDEHQMLMTFFAEFVNICDDRTITSPVFFEEGTIKGVCAVCPEIEFEGSKFVFTGASSRYPRTALSETVEQLGGRVVGNGSIISSSVPAATLVGHTLVTAAKWKKQLSCANQGCAWLSSTKTTSMTPYWIEPESRKKGVWKSFMGGCF